MMAGRDRCLILDLAYHCLARPRPYLAARLRGVQGMEHEEVRSKKCGRNSPDPTLARRPCSGDNVNGAKI